MRLLTAVMKAIWFRILLTAVASQIRSHKTTIRRLRSRQSAERLGDPIFPLSGSQKEDIVDYSTGGTDPLKFERYYGRNGKGMWHFGDISRLGNGWRSNFDASLQLENSNNEAYITLPDGSDYSFVISSGVFVPSAVVDDNPFGNYWALEIVPNRLGNPETVVVDGSNYDFTDLDDTVWVFNSSGKLTEIRFRGGYVQDLTYDGNYGSEYRSHG